MAAEKPKTPRKRKPKAVVQKIATPFGQRAQRRWAVVAAQTVKAGHARNGEIKTYAKDDLDGRNKGAMFPNRRYRRSKAATARGAVGQTTPLAGDAGGYRVLHPTKGWRSFSTSRLARIARVDTLTQGWARITQIIAAQIEAKKELARGY